MSAAGALDPDVEAKLNARVRRPSPGFARAIALAAIRETFEETGLAIGVSGNGAPDKAPPGVWARFAATGVYPALNDIDFLARAITPPGRPKRFDARFLVIDARYIAKSAPKAINLCREHSTRASFIHRGAPSGRAARAAGYFRLRPLHHQSFIAR